MRKIFCLILFLCLSLFISGCASSSVKNTSLTTSKIQTVSMEDAMIAWQNKEVLFVDVRTNNEIQEGHIPRAILIPLSELEKRSNEIPKDKRVYLICRSGSRSAQANLLLQQLGFTQTYSVDSGMNKWNLEIEK